MSRQNYGSPLEHLHMLSKGKISLAEGETFRGKDKKHIFTCTEGHTFERTWESYLKHQPKCPECIADAGFFQSSKGGVITHQKDKKVTLPPLPF